jgi:hypothetical protein
MIRVMEHLDRLLLIGDSRGDENIENARHTRRRVRSWPASITTIVCLIFCLDMKCETECGDKFEIAPGHRAFALHKKMRKTTSDIFPLSV